MKSWASLLHISFLLSGCATGPHANPRDPLEPLNRTVYRFNDAVDSALLKPVATAYHEVVPTPVRHGISNFFDNLQDAWSFANNALQLKGRAATDSLSRFGVNTFLGLGGILDVASEMHIEKHTKDFGHTLGFWGVAAGPYLVLPLLGPSSLRDTAALTVDQQGDIAANITHVPTRNSVMVVRMIDAREGLLKATGMLEQVALDKYAFTRDFYLQHRRNTIFDGNPPDDDSDHQCAVLD
ncbi:MAG: VacJ family lipoprotein [Rhodoferax sp.]|uniref:MlaA family lipoprotein n=1 Tax=Rhodoferax sp. TaxID=50421 RepID=UPI001401B0B3|nr:VacJ family lipoprotein [Rhodoferax sp.]NDP40122.1 VacJ family lipoprotein [Rhodoferax sp.]